MKWTNWANTQKMSRKQWNKVSDEVVTQLVGSQWKQVIVWFQSCVRVQIELIDHIYLAMAPIIHVTTLTHTTFVKQSKMCACTMLYSLLRNTFGKTFDHIWMRHVRLNTGLCVCVCAFAKHVRVHVIHK